MPCRAWITRLRLHARSRALFLAAFVWRRLLFRTTFVVITGSAGKTTAKELLAAALATRAPTAATWRNRNDRFGVPRSVLGVRPYHRYAVIEVGIDGDAAMRRAARLTRPHVAVILNVKGTHTTSFRDLDHHAHAKGILLQWLRPGGLAVLNGEDARVAALGRTGRFRRVRFGTSSERDLWADGISARWPERLRFRAHAAGESVAVATRLVGAHWIDAALGALSAAQACGVALPDAAAAFARVEPFPGRLAPMRLPSGAVVLRDDYNASWDASRPALRVLAEARAERRWLVVTDFSDFGRNRKARLKALAREAARACDRFVLIGERAAYGTRRAVEAGLGSDAVWSFAWPEQAAGFLRSALGPGDLVLLKGRTTDHAARIYFGLLGEVRCRRRQCEKRFLCDDCPELGTPEADRARAQPEPPHEDAGSDIRAQR
jgi:UDP-N-acetylmuramoyl-tripeptide--D-alanyl-D-alanine ligase